MAKQKKRKPAQPGPDARQVKSLRVKPHLYDLNWTGLARYLEGEWSRIRQVTLDDVSPEYRREVSQEIGEFILDLAGSLVREQEKRRMKGGMWLTHEHLTKLVEMNATKGNLLYCMEELGVIGEKKKKK
mgnify:CR=1 FL=1